MVKSIDIIMNGHQVKYTKEMLLSLAAKHSSIKDIAKEMGVNTAVVHGWCGRYHINDEVQNIIKQNSLDGIKATFSKEAILSIISDENIIAEKQLMKSMKIAKINRYNEILELSPGLKEEVVAVIKENNMMAKYGKNYREDVVSYYLEVKSVRQTAIKFNTQHPNVTRILTSCGIDLVKFARKSKDTSNTTLPPQP